MVPSQQEKVLRIFDFVAKEQDYGLDRLFSSVHIIPQKEIVLVRRITTVVEYFQKVLILSVNISNDFDWGFKLQEHWLGKEYFSRCLTYCLDLGFTHLNVMTFLFGSES